MNNYILFTIDVEDWFQVENFKPYIPFSSWPEHDLRVEKNTHRVLDILNSQNIKATFFILGWLAKRLPRIVRKIHKQGHEVASHGYYHNLCSNELYTKLKKDLKDSKKLLEDIIGQEVIGYRAPSFSINNDILKIIEECGYSYDSSYNSFERHGRYGRINFSPKLKNGIALKISDKFYELPISNLKIKKHIIPWGGGGYFRILPFSLFKHGIRSILNQDNAYLFYMHPWEIDPEQPKVSQASFNFKFRHYINLHKTEAKLNAMLHSFQKCCFITCREYINKNI